MRARRRLAWCFPLLVPARIRRRRGYVKRSPRLGDSPGVVLTSVVGGA